MRNSRFVMMLLLSLTSFYVNAQNNVKFEFRANPVLQNISTNGVTVFWDVNNSALSRVEYGEGNVINNKVVSYKWGMADISSGIQKVKLENLKPGTLYHYRVVSKEIKTIEPYKVIYGDSVVSPVYSFKTPPANEKEFSFITFNDIHNVPSYIESVFKAEKEFDFSLFNGDIFTDLNDEADYSKKIFAPLSSFGTSEKPSYFIRGNHETRGAAARSFYKYFDSPTGNFYYTFTRGNTFFIMMDCGEDKPDYNKNYFGLAGYDNYRTKEAEWLKEVVKSKEFKKAKFRIACLHMPITIDPGTDSEEGHGAYDCSVKFAPILNKAGIALLLSGHTHKYGIIKPGKDTNKFPVIVGGAYYSEKNPARVAYVKVDVTPNKITAVLKNVKSEVIDKVEIRK